MPQISPLHQQEVSNLISSEAPSTNKYGLFLLFKEAATALMNMSMDIDTDNPPSVDEMNERAQEMKVEKSDEFALACVNGVTTYISQVVSSIVQDTIQEMISSGQLMSGAPGGGGMNGTGGQDGMV